MAGAVTQSPMPAMQDAFRISLMIQQAGQAWDVLQSRQRGPACAWPMKAATVRLPR